MKTKIYLGQRSEDRQEDLKTLQRMGVESVTIEYNPAAFYSKKKEEETWEIDEEDLWKELEKRPVRIQELVMLTASDLFTEMKVPGPLYWTVLDSQGSAVSGKCESCREGKQVCYEDSSVHVAADQLSSGTFFMLFVNPGGLLFVFRVRKDLEGKWTCEWMDVKPTGRVQPPRPPLTIAPTCGREEEKGKGFVNGYKGGGGALFPLSTEVSGK
jgi:hypothetical protein